MARQTNAAYWAQRLKNMEGALLDQSFGYVENMERNLPPPRLRLSGKSPPGISALRTPMASPLQTPSAC